MRAIASLIVLASLAAGQAIQASAPTAVVRDAIVDAVRSRLGADAEVTVSRLEVTGWRDPRFVRAVPDPAARIGSLMSFKLIGSDDRGAAAIFAGRATAFVDVAIEHARTRTLVERGQALASGDVEAARDGLTNLPLRRLPRPHEVEGAKALINLSPGAVVTAAAIVARPAVKAGQIVTARARIGEVEAVASVTAVQDGMEGDVIRVVNKQSRRELRARVIEAGIVEVMR